MTTECYNKRLNGHVLKARDFAIKSHGDQTYGDSELPFVDHLDVVADILAPYGTDAQIAGYLHDVVEDTNTTLNDIYNTFGRRIADCVELVTDSPGKNRKERKARTNDKLHVICIEDDTLPLLVKAADRLANLRQSKHENSSKLQMYEAEHIAFADAVYRDGLCDDLWDEMQDILDGTNENEVFEVCETEYLLEHDLSTEQWREYDFSGREYRIEEPKKLFTRPSGGTTHRVVDKDNIVHCLPAPGHQGCVLRWLSKDPNKPVNF